MASPHGSEAFPRPQAIEGGHGPLSEQHVLWHHQNQPRINHFSAVSLRTEMFSGVEWENYDSSKVPSESVSSQDWNNAERSSKYFKNAKRMTIISTQFNFTLYGIIPFKAFLVLISHTAWLNLWWNIKPSKAMKRLNNSIIPLIHCLQCVRPSDTPQQATGSASGDAAVPARLVTVGSRGARAWTRLILIRKPTFFLCTSCGLI